MTTEDTQQATDEQDETASADEVELESTVDGPAEAGSSRRSVLKAAGVLGLAGLSSQAASATTESGDHLGEEWTGDPGTGYGLKIATPDAAGFWGVSQASSGFTEGLRGEALSTKGRGILGIATSNSGNTNGVYGKANSPNGNGIYGLNTATTGSAKGLLGRTDSESGVGLEGYASASSGTTYGVRGRVASSGGYGIYTPDNAKIEGDLEVTGNIIQTDSSNDLQVSGTKNFVQTADTATGPKQITYTAVEAGEARTETSDVAEMEDGIAVVDLPDHFGMVTSSDEPLSIQVTPYADEKVHPQVTDQSTDRIVVKDLGDRRDDYTFAYTVKGIREGFEDQPVVRDA